MNVQKQKKEPSYLIFDIFFTQAKFLENKIYTEIQSKFLCFTVYYCVLHSKYTVNCQFFALNL